MTTAYLQERADYLSELTGKKSKSEDTMVILMLLTQIMVQFMQ